jgi:hypothetical protein
MLAATDGNSLLAEPLTVRRAALEAFVAELRCKDIVLSPCTRDVAKAEKWLMDSAGGSTDGVIAKPLNEPYQPGERVMIKVKKLRTADCVVGGFRYLSSKRQVGSLLLGLYNDEGELDHVGFTSTISNEERPALTKKLRALRAPPGFTGKAPGRPSRLKRQAGWRTPQLLQLPAIATPEWDRPSQLALRIVVPPPKRNYTTLPLKSSELKRNQGKLLNSLNKVDFLARPNEARIVAKPYRASLNSRKERKLRDHRALLGFSRRTPLKGFAFVLFFWSMNCPVSRLRFVQCASPSIFVLSWDRFRIDPLRELSPAGRLTAMLPSLIANFGKRSSR